MREEPPLAGAGSIPKPLLRTGLAGVQDPSKPCVKNHHSLVLRAESASEKFMWLARLKNASDGGGTSGRAPLRSYTSDQLRADSVTSSVAPTPRSDGARRGGVRSLVLQSKLHEMRYNIILSVSCSD